MIIFQNNYVRGIFMEFWNAKGKKKTIKVFQKKK